MKNLSKETTIIIVNDFDYVQGGASKVAIDTANLLYENGYNIIFFYGHSNSQNELNIGIKKVGTNQKEALKEKNKIKGIVNGIYNFKAKKKFKNLIKTLDINNTIIHVHGWTKCLSSSVFDIAFKKKFKVILTLHDYFIDCPNGGYFNYPKNKACQLNGLSTKCIRNNCDSRNYFFKVYRLFRQFIQNKIVKLPKKINNIIYISDLQWELLKKIFIREINAKKILNPINLSQKEAISNFQENNYYLYVGRVSKEKGVNIFCEACKILRVNGIVVGDGDQKDSLKEKYPSINFVGWRSKNEVENYMLKAKSLVFPSLWYEGAPLTIDEALSLGLPCIVSDISSAKEKIIDGKNGYIFQTNNVTDLVSCMKKINSLEFKNINNSNNKEQYLNQLIEFYSNLYKE